MRLPWSKAETRSSTLENPSNDLVAALTAADLEIGGYFSPAPVTVTPLSSLRSATVFACVRVIAETIASLPVHLYAKDGPNRVLVEDDPRAWIVGVEPNPEIDAVTFYEILLGHLNLWGNSYVYKTIDPVTGLTEELWPLLPSRTRPIRNPDNSLAFVTVLDTGEQRVLSSDEVIHIRSFGTGEGGVGISPIGAARQSIGLAIAADDYAARFYLNDARPGGILTTEKSMNQTAYDLFKKRWNAGHQGLSNKHLLGILDNGMKWQDVGIPNQDSQFIETRKFSKSEIASVFRVPPHLVGVQEAGSVSYASVEMFEIEFVTHTLRPWAVRLEQAMRRGLFGSEPDRRAGLFMRIETDGLMRGDMNARANFYEKGIASGWLLKNEVRTLEDLPVIDGLDDQPPQEDFSDIGEDIKKLLEQPPNTVPEGEPLEEQREARIMQAIKEARVDPIINVHVPEQPVKVELFETPEIQNANGNGNTHSSDTDSD